MKSRKRPLQGKSLEIAFWKTEVIKISRIYKLHITLNFKWKAHNWTQFFWKSIELFLSNKVKSSEIIKFAEEDGTLMKNEGEIAVKLNNFFSNAVINLKIPMFENFDPLSENIDHPALKAKL